MLTFWKVFVINWYCVLSEAFSASIEMIIGFLLFSVFIWYITLIHLCILKNPFIPGINQLDHSIWSFQCVVGFYLFVFCWGYLHVCSSVILACDFLFLWCRCPVLVSEWWWARKMSLEVFLRLNFWKSLRRIGG